MIQGDISLEDFGLSYEDFRGLGPKIDYVVHTAAMVKHVGIYMEFERINILATQRIVQFCQEYKIPLGYTSTISVSGHGVKQNKEGLVFSEDDLYIGQEFESNHYIKSKLVAEDLVLKEMMAGTLCCSIFRVGYLTGRYSDGMFQKNHHENAFYNALKMIIDKGSISSDFMDLMLDFTPVDLCSEAIVKTILDTNQQNRILNLFNWNKISVQQFVASVQDRFDINLSHMSASEYIHSLSADHANNYIINYIQQAVESTQIELKYDKTEHYLHGIGFYWKQVDKAYLEKIIDYCAKVKLF